MEVSTPPTVLGKKRSSWVRIRPYNQGLSDRWNHSPPQTGAICYRKQLQCHTSMFCKTWIPDLFFLSNSAFPVWNTVQCRWDSSDPALYCHSMSPHSLLRLPFSLCSTIDTFRVQFTWSVLYAGRDLNRADESLNFPSERWQICSRNQLSDGHFGTVSHSCPYLLCSSCLHLKFCCWIQPETPSISLWIEMDGSLVC